MSVTLDDVDRKILELLQQNALMTNAEIGLEVGMSAPSVFERIRKLKQRRVIQRFTAIIDPAAVGKTLTAFIRLTVAYDEKHDAGIAAVTWVAPMTVVGRALPFHRTTAPLRKLVPATESVKAGSPTLALVGLMDDRTGGDTL